jgi:quinol monooxygenase YgiN
MPLYQIRIDIQEDKIDEFIRTLQSLWFKFLKEEGCLSYRVYREFEKENTFCMVGEFATHEAMETHFQARDFEVLVGAARVLGKAFKMITAELLDKGGSDLAKSKLASRR